MTTPTRRFNVIPLREDVLTAHGVWIAPATLKTWRATGKHPELFLVISHRIHLDLDAWERHFMQPARLERDHIMDLVKN